MDKKNANTLKDILCVILLILAMIYSRIAPAMAYDGAQASAGQNVCVEEKTEMESQTPSQFIFESDWM